MTQSDLLNIVASTISSFVGKSYIVDYTPARNLSERQANKELYRYVRPSAWKRERTSRGTPEVRADITIGVIGFTSDNTATIQNELDWILYKMLTLNTNSFIVVAGETVPPQSQPVSGEDLESDVLNGQLTVSIRFLDAPTHPYSVNNNA